MSYRYKQALLSLASLALIYGWYVATVLAGERQGQPARLVGTVVAIVVAQIIGNIIITGTSSDRYQAMDERERAFDRRATGIGYYLVIAGSLMAVATFHLGARAPDMANALLAAIVVAECARQGLFLLLHHRAA